MMKPLRLQIPAEITTERLLLRNPQLGDGALIIDTIIASLNELKPWLPWATEDYDVNHAEDWCRRSASQICVNEQAGYLILHRETGRYMGNISAWAKGWSVPKFEIGYWLATRENGHGYMTEAVRAVTQMAFDDFKARRIEIRTDALNHRSRRVAERCGYTLDGIFKNDQRNAKGDLADEGIYSLTK